jgi:hypothetical protein
MASSLMTAPVGLAGELMRTARVREVIRSRTAAGSSAKPSASTVDTVRRRPSAYRMKFG